MAKKNYGEAIREGFAYLLQEHPEVFVIGQGLWSPWYVGNSMQDLDVEFGKDRLIDTPVSELVCTGAAIGASLCGNTKSIVVHPRVDFALLAIDQIVNQAAKWSYMLGGQASPAVVVRAIINRGGEQGAQHSQSLHSWFAHVPGLRVVMPSSAKDARDLLIASTLSTDPVIYIDDRWLYDREEELGPVEELDLAKIGPKLTRTGSDVTLVGTSYSTYLCEQAADKLAEDGITADVIDMRVINPLDYDLLIKSFSKTKKLVVVDGCWKPAGMASEIISGVVENMPGETSFSSKDFASVTLPFAPAPTSKVLEDKYYPDVSTVISKVKQVLG